MNARNGQFRRIPTVENRNFVITANYAFVTRGWSRKRAPRRALILGWQLLAMQ